MMMIMMATMTGSYGITKGFYLLPNAHLYLINPIWLYRFYIINFESHHPIDQATVDIAKAITVMYATAYQTRILLATIFKMDNSAKRMKRLQNLPTASQWTDKAEYWCRLFNIAKFQIVNRKFGGEIMKDGRELVLLEETQAYPPRPTTPYEIWQLELI